MTERAFEQALQRKNNKRNLLRRFVIAQARHILQAAGVIDPVITKHAVATKPKVAVEHSFYMIPEGEGVRFSLDIGDKSAEQLEAEVKAIGREVTSWASDMLHSAKFNVLEEVTPQELLKLHVRALGLPGNPTTRQLYERIPQTKYGEEYVLELSRAEVGPHLAIADKDQAKDDYYYVMHQSITVGYGYPSVFEVVHDSRGRFLGGAWADPDGEWDPDLRLVVALRQTKTLNLLKTIVK